ncbi:hypothetical protein FEM48_Zijuj01G0157000 [Ziziphus jujuba var. spinosa]|uniref:SNF2 N-terminal domain-containing protein n=1 Tax=Ziziphus jujuba var. spinosa TaxID=714518 RepID=A0A978W241_ZIZJJ|nr:hypothetical protein FEM48_Zijuj01G0157000 [Ziziphus jujuba var. spinosa]
MNYMLVAFHMILIEVDPLSAGVQYDKEFTVWSLDFLSGLAEGLGSGIESLSFCMSFPNSYGELCNVVWMRLQMSDRVDLPYLVTLLDLWIFPASSLSLVEKQLSEISGAKVQVENLDSLVHRAIATALAIPDLQASCIRGSWPVLIMAPSSLRLQWASIIQQWLDISPYDILVVLTQCGGSNRGGFTIVSSNSQVTIHLGGLFNIILYDVVPNLQNLLMAPDFKVVIANESHFLKNAKAKRTTAFVPFIKPQIHAESA